MAFIDYYKILGVKKDIAQADVKKAYLKRAKQFHPDLHPDDPKAKSAQCDCLFFSDQFANGNFYHYGDCRLLC